MENPDVDVDAVTEKAIEKVTGFNDNKEAKTEIELIAFGLKALKIMFVMDENKGASDELEKEISDIDGVQSVECVDVRRTIG